MADLFAIRRGDMLLPLTADDLDALRKLPIGKPLRADVRQPRNYEFHKKVFSLINLAFSYWEPETMVTQVERDTCIKLGRFLVANGLDETTANTLIDEFLAGLNISRETVEAEKSIEAFRNWVTVEAGFYDTVRSPAGPRRVAKSWSFAKMSEEQFEAMFQQILTVCWNLVLSKHFETPEQARIAADQMMSYA